MLDILFQIFITRFLLAFLSTRGYLLLDYVMNDKAINRIGSILGFEIEF